jgi:thioredoxin reductase
MDFDGVIVGGSYAGLSAAMQLARARRRVCVVDAGKPRNRFASTSHGFFGFDGVAPREMIARARAQVLTYPSVTLIEGEVSAACQTAGGGFRVELASGGAVAAAGLILAHGVEDVLPAISGVAERWGTTVLHCPYCHGYEFGGRRLGVLNLTPMAVHQALLISDWGPTTFFLNGADELDDEAREHFDRRDVSVEPAPVAELVGDAPSLAGVRLADGRIVAVEALFLGPSRNLRPLASQLGCEIEQSPLGPVIRTDAQQLTTVPGVYAAGDVATAAGNATFASAAGVMAGVALHRSLIFDPLA